MKMCPLACRTLFFHFSPHVSNRMLWESRESCTISVIVNEGDVNKDYMQRFDWFFWFLVFFYFIEPFRPT